jgi:hypothetical protein
MDSTRKVIEQAWEARAALNAGSAPRALREAVEEVIAGPSRARR